MPSPTSQREVRFTAYPDAESDQCRARRSRTDENSLVCTRGKGHHGPHAAADHWDDVGLVWYDDPPLPHHITNLIDRLIFAAAARARHSNDRQLADARTDLSLAILRLYEKADGPDGLREAAQELHDAAVEVNARYIGGSPLRGKRFSDAMDRLALAQAKCRAALAGSAGDRAQEDA